MLRHEVRTLPFNAWETYPEAIFGLAGKMSDCASDRALADGLRCVPQLLRSINLLGVKRHAFLSGG
jgi:hypothetical protein